MERTERYSHVEPGGARSLAEERGPSVDELITGMEQARAPRARAGEPRMRAVAATMAERAFRLNDISRPAASTLFRQTAAHLNGLLFSGQLAGQPALAPSRFIAEPPVDPDEAAARLLVAVESTLPPDSYLEVLAAMNSRVSGAGQVAEALADIPSLGGFIMQLVNSPAYGLSAPVRSLSRAVAMAGFNEVFALALAASVARHCRALRPLREDSALFWQRAVVRGIYARRLAVLAGLPGEWFFSAGMLADVGALLARRTLPSMLERAHDLALMSDLSRHEAETVVLGTSLARLGARLLSHWGAPERLVELVGQRADTTGCSMDPALAVMHLAEVMAESACAGLPGALPVSRLEPQALESLGLTAEDLVLDASATLFEASVLVRSFLSR